MRWDDRYPRRFYVRWHKTFQHVVTVQSTHDGCERVVAGPFWRWITAARVMDALRQTFNDGIDVGTAPKVT